MRDTPAMLRELKVVEQRYRALLEVLSGIPVIEVADLTGWRDRLCIGGWRVTGRTESQD